MERFGLSTFRLQGECSSQAELHWHENKKSERFNIFSKRNYKLLRMTQTVIL